MEVKSVIDALAQRRSIRSYKNEDISTEQLAYIYEAIRNTPTSVNGQQFSVIDVSDSELKRKMGEITNMKHVETCSHFFLFCADYHKEELLAKDMGIELAPFHDTVEGLLVGTVDATLAMMSAIVAAEAIGLGSCCIGYARIANQEAMCNLVDLPKDSYVVCGLTVGIPDIIPDLKPKQPISLSIHSNRYSSDSDMLPLLREYNDTIDKYNKIREGGTQVDYDWISREAGYYAAASEVQMRGALRERGFLLMH